MPSLAASDMSAFSNATETESEMTEGGDFFPEEGSMTPRQTYFMCYATDLLSAYEQIKKRSLSGVKAVDDVSFCSTCITMYWGMRLHTGVLLCASSQLSSLHTGSCS